MLAKSNDGLWKYIDASIAKEIGAVNTSEVGLIRKVNGNLLDIYLLNMKIEIRDIPFVTLQGGGQFLQFPIKENDECIVFFTKHNNDGWHDGDSDEVRKNPTFNVSNGIALIGVSSQANAIDAPKHPTLQVDKLEITNGTEDLISLISDLMDLVGTVLDENKDLALEASKIMNANVDTGTPTPIVNAGLFATIGGNYATHKTDLGKIKNKFDSFKT